MGRRLREKVVAVGVTQDVRRRSPRVGLVLEQTLGHVAHAANLRDLVPRDRRIEAVFADVEFPVDGAAARLPGYGNWTVRAGLRARRAIRRIRSEGTLDALFIHTQVPAILSPDHLRRTPTVVSLDATPIQYDELGAHYHHTPGPAWVEQLKWRANRACFRAARRVVTWAEWTKTGLAERYDVDPAKVVVIPPGVDVSRWSAQQTKRRDDDVVRVLFVGGDLTRKGGHHLVDAIRVLRQRGTNVEVDIVSRDDVVPEPGVRIHQGLGPNSAALIDLYRGADVFCLPTLGDCLPMVLSEAGAVGLPLVSTDVGAISEIVHDNESGLLTSVGNVGELAAAIERLALDPALRRRLGDGAARLVRERFDAGRNARQLVALLAEVAEEGR